MSSRPAVTPPYATRLATVSDSDAIGQMLFDFNTEYGDPTPSPTQLSDRLKVLLARGDTAVVLVGEAPDGLALLRFRPSLWSEGQECYIAEFYVRPTLRGHGRGKALMTTVLEHARQQGADYIDPGTSEDDVAARHLYESFGFTNHESRPDGPIMYVFEREL